MSNHYNLRSRTVSPQGPSEDPLDFFSPELRDLFDASQDGPLHNGHSPSLFVDDDALIGVSPSGQDRPEATSSGQDPPGGLIPQEDSFSGLSPLEGRLLSGLVDFVHRNPSYLNAAFTPPPGGTAMTPGNVFESTTDAFPSNAPFERIGGMNLGSDRPNGPNPGRSNGVVGPYTGRSHDPHSVSYLPIGNISTTVGKRRRIQRRAFNEVRSGERSGDLTSILENALKEHMKTLSISMNANVEVIASIRDWRDSDMRDLRYGRNEVLADIKYDFRCVFSYT